MGEGVATTYLTNASSQADVGRSLPLASDHDGTYSLSFRWQTIHNASPRACSYSPVALSSLLLLSEVRRDSCCVELPTARGKTFHRKRFPNVGHQRTKASTGHPGFPSWRIHREIMASRITGRRAQSMLFVSFHFLQHADRCPYLLMCQPKSK